MVVLAPREDLVDLPAIEQHGDAQRCRTIAVRDPRICTGSEQALDLLQVAADYGAVEQCIAERILVVDVAEAVAFHAPMLPHAEPSRLQLT